METKRSKAKVPLITTVILLILLVAGTAYDLRIQKAQEKALNATQSLTQKAQTIPPVQSKKFIKTHGYRVIVPHEYKVREDEQNGTVSFLKIVKEESDQESIVISRAKTNAKDPCLKNIDGYPYAKCRDISEYRMLDWGTETDKSGPLHYRYTVIEGGYEYEINFIGISPEEKDTILATFKLT